MQAQTNTQEAPAEDTLEFAAAWIDSTMNASFWWRSPNVPPLWAAILLKGDVPQPGREALAEVSTNDELGPEEFNLLRMAFAMCDTTTPRTLADWLAVADQWQLKTHSWVRVWSAWQQRQTRAHTIASPDTVAPFPDEPPLSGIPGKLPKNSIGRLAVKAAWEIEADTGERANAKSVMRRLQAWADDGDEPDTLLRSEPAKRSVVWLSANLIEHHYTLEALTKALKLWHASRAALP